MSMNTKAIVKGLEAFTSCDVADALLKLKVPHGGFLSGLTMWSPRRQEGPTKIVGPAYTVKYVRKSYENEPKPAGHYIDGVPDGAVVFISAPPRMINACYGGLMSNRAKYLGAVGAVIDGRLRDLQEHRDLQYPVFARDVGTTAPQEVVRVSEINAPVRLNSEDQDAIISPGDIIIGDINGVVCLPQSLAEKALDLIQSQVDGQYLPHAIQSGYAIGMTRQHAKREAADNNVAGDIQKGRTVAEAMKEHRAHVKQP